MPEGPEIETEKLHEAINEELERVGGGFLKQIALSTAILAAFGAVATLQAGATVNHALVLKTEAARLQSEASDKWAFYQAKGIKAAVQASSANAWKVSGKEAPPEFEASAKRYEEEQAEIQKEAKEKEAEIKEKSAEADELLHRHHKFANTVALFQVSIALGAVAALTRKRFMWVGSMLVGGAGIVLFMTSFMH